MVRNGFIKYGSEVPGGFTTDGDIKAPVLSFSLDVPVNLKVINHNYTKVNNDQYLTQKYHIMVDFVDSPTLDFTTIKSVQITNTAGIDVGIFQIQEIRVLTLSKRIKIIV